MGPILLAIFLVLAQGGTPFSPGQVIPEIKAAADPAQSYALYLPSNYSTSKPWPLILAFDPGARGTTAIERFRAAAEQYGYIVAASNTSRNYRDNDTAVETMAGDVLQRFRVNDRRVYTTGMSGGARVALGTALASTGIAGVIASSAGFPDGTPRKTVPFVIFGTAGTEDFNHLEMRRLDQVLTTPHYLRVFEGGHTWLSSDIAIEAVEWMEVQAIRIGTAPKDRAAITKLFDKRRAAADAEQEPATQYLMLKSIADDFDGLADVGAILPRVEALAGDPRVTAEIRRGREEDNHETDVLLAIKANEAKLANQGQRKKALTDLAAEWKRLSDAATAADDSHERRLARRVLSLLGSTAATKDADYQKIVAQYRFGRPRP